MRAAPRRRDRRRRDAASLARHGNKLRPGHLKGNRFRILLRGADPARAADADRVLDRLRAEGLPNAYGPQRFGRDGETARLGLGVVRGNARPPRSPFLKKLSLSAAQSVLFNRCLARRMNDGLLRRVLPGDVLAKWPAGGMFTAEDVPVEQERFDRREVVSAGPMFGKKTFPTHAEARIREDAVLAEAVLVPAAFEGFGKLLMGTRRHNLVYVDDLTAAWEPDGLRLTFALPAGCYATVLVREVSKGDLTDDDAPVED